MEWAEAPPEAPTTSPLTFFSFLSKVPPPLMRESRRSSADWGGWGGGLSAFLGRSTSGLGLAGAVWVVEVLLVDLTEARGELGLESLGSGVASNVVSTVALVVGGLSLSADDWWCNLLGEHLTISIFPSHSLHVLLLFRCCFFVGFFAFSVQLCFMCWIHWWQTHAKQCVRMAKWNFIHNLLPVRTRT